MVRVPKIAQARQFHDRLRELASVATTELPDEIRDHLDGDRAEIVEADKDAWLNELCDLIDYAEGTLKDWNFVIEHLRAICTEASKE